MNHFASANTMQILPLLERPRLEGIEALRAVAALMIVIYHMVLLPPLEIPPYLDVIKTHFGKGVPLFFSLSGFVLAYGYIDNLDTRQRIIQFYIRRYFRIAPLFYLMLAVWITVFLLTHGSFPGSYQDLVLNALFMFGMVPGKHESIVAAGWSIGVEMLFYLIFPAIAVLASTLRACFLALIISILISSMAFTALTEMGAGSFAYMNLITHLPNFLAGMMAFLAWRHTGYRTSRLAGTILFATTIAGALLIIYLPTVQGMLGSVKGVRLDMYCWSVLFMTLILATCFWPPRMLTNQVSTFMGKISFSLYLWHPLIIILLPAAYSIVNRSLGSGLLGFAASFSLTICLVSFISYYSYKFIETPGMRFGKHVSASV